MRSSNVETVASQVTTILNGGSAKVDNPFFSKFGGRKMFVGLLCMTLSITLGLIQSLGVDLVFTVDFVQGIFYAGIGLITGGNVVEHLASSNTTKNVTADISNAAKAGALYGHAPYLPPKPPTTVDFNSDEDYMSEFDDSRKMPKVSSERSLL